jgi:hypothetical protein
VDIEKQWDDNHDTAQQQENANKRMTIREQLMQQDNDTTR